jgi:hypothetical protein
MKTNASITELQKALQIMNKKQGYAIRFKRLEQTGKRVTFTITSDSKIPGAKTSESGRNLAVASWHAHGFLFDELFKLRNDIYIISLGDKLTAESGNWINENNQSELSIL